MNLNLLRKYNFLHLITLCLFLASAPAHATDIKIATLSPDGTSWMNKMRQAASEIAKRTSDRVKIKYYPGGVMGDENAILRKMRINQLHGAAVTSGSLTQFYIDADIYGLLFLFKSQDEVNYVRNQMDKLIIQGLKEKGLISFGLAESGFAYIMSNEITKSVADLHNQKVWIPDTAAARDAAKAFKINPIPLPISDVLAGLQTSLINTIASSPIASIALQWHTQVKYLTDMPLSYGWGTLVVSEKTLNKLSKDDQAVVHEIMSSAFKEINEQNQKDNIAAFAALKTQGITFIKPDTKQQAEWLDLAKRSHLQLVKNGYNSQKMYDLVYKHIEDYKK